MTPPTMLPMFASPSAGNVSGSSLSEVSGAIIPAEPPDGREATAVVVWAGSSAMGVSVDGGSGSVSIWLGCSGFVSSSEGAADAAGAVKEDGSAAEVMGDKVGTAIATVSELVDAGPVGGAEVTTATCEGTGASLLDSSAGRPGPAATGPDGAMFASGSFRTDDIRTALLVPVAEVTAASVVGATSGCCAGAVEDSGAGSCAGGASAALV
jgi:hypothetical protein